MSTAAGDPLDGFEEPETTPQHRRRRRRRRRIALAVILALLLGVVLVVGGYLFSLRQSYYAKSTRVALSTQKPQEAAGENFLLLGSDRRDPEAAEAEHVSGQRSDVMMLVHVSADKQSVYVMSFPRDLYVDIPGHGKDRINAAIAFGGVPLAVTTVQDYTGVPIDHVALIDFDGIKGLVDVLGGVDVRVDQSFEGDGVSFTAGTQHMDGETALTYVRQRKQLAEGDFARNRHQRDLLSAILGEIISRETLSDPLKIKDMVDTVSPFLTVDDGLTASEMVSLGYSLRDVRSQDIFYLEMPHGDPTTTSGGASVVSTDEEAMDVLRTALREDDMAAYYSERSRAR